MLVSLRFLREVFVLGQAEEAREIDHEVEVLDHGVEELDVVEEAPVDYLVYFWSVFVELSQMFEAEVVDAERDQ